MELPADLPADVLEKLSGTRISGKLIEIRADRGAPRRDERGDRGDRPARKPQRG